MKAQTKYKERLKAVLGIGLFISLSFLSIAPHLLPKKPKTDYGSFWKNWNALTLAVMSYQGDGLDREREKGVDLNKMSTNAYNSFSQKLFPPTLDALVPKYLEAIPIDAYGCNKVVTIYDGTGGWVYDKNSGETTFNFPASNELLNEFHVSATAIADLTTPVPSPVVEH